MLTIAQLRSMDETSLRTMNANIATVIREKIGQRQREAASAFRVGDQARFVHNGRTVTIRIQRFNEKTVGGIELDASGNETRSKWRVAPSFLTKVEAKPKTIAPAGDSRATVGMAGTF